MDKTFGAKETICGTQSEQASIKPCPETLAVALLLLACSSIYRGTIEDSSHLSCQTTVFSTIRSPCSTPPLPN